MKFARFSRLLLAVALLLAQQAALAHQVWHSTSGTGKPVTAEQGKKANPLCEQHEALGTVLGVLSGGLVHAPTVELAAVHFPPASVPAASVSSLSPSSRGPPALL